MSDSPPPGKYQNPFFSSKSRLEKSEVPNETFPNLISFPSSWFCHLWIQFFSFPKRKEIGCEVEGVMFFFQRFGKPTLTCRLCRGSNNVGFSFENPFFHTYASKPLRTYMFSVAKFCLCRLDYYHCKYETNPVCSSFSPPSLLCQRISDANINEY